jgi:hypothetical protein
MTLPTGTVTFLFTDIEGSTKLLKSLGDDYAGVLADIGIFCAQHSKNGMVTRLIPKETPFSSPFLEPQTRSPLLLKVKDRSTNTNGPIWSKFASGWDYTPASQK